VKEHDLLFATLKSNLAPPQQQQQRQGGGGQSEISPQQFIEYVKTHPEFFNELLATNPPLATAVLENNLQTIGTILAEGHARKRREEAEKQKRIAQLNADPFNLEAQKAIEEEIRMENVNANMESAMEYHPEAFGSVHMLYIDCDVNGVPIKAFVDSGAQSTIMSTSCAERCGLMRLLDPRFAGVAKGVGTARIAGRVHVAPIKIGDSFFPSSFSIIENQGVDFLLGLDYLKRYQCCIDLRANLLRIGDESVSFLAEKDIPRSLRDSTDSLDPTSGIPSSPAPSHSTTTTTTTRPPSATPVQTPAPTTPTPVSAPVKAAPTPIPSGESEFPEETVQQLMAITNVPRARAIEVLRACRGNVDMAASTLMGW
jgi:DNA damage-inducible protein 1